MQEEDFLKLLQSPKKVDMQLGSWESLGGSISDTYRGVPWEFRYQLAEAVASIDFDCAFQDGKCVVERCDWLAMRMWKESKEYQNNGVNYCCCTCNLTIGNLHTLPNDRAVLTEIANLFSKDTGFWREGGCILPAKYRSRQCLIHRCDHLRRYKPLNEEDMWKIYRLVNIKSVWKKHKEQS